MTTTSLVEIQQQNIANSKSMNSKMEVLQQARDSVTTSDSDNQLLYSSDEFMEELLRTNNDEALEALEESLYSNTSKVLEIIQAPRSEEETKEIRKKFAVPKEDLRQHMKKEASFCSTFSDGITVKPKLSPKRSPKIFRKASSKMMSLETDKNEKVEEEIRKEIVSPKKDLRQHLKKEATFNSKFVDGVAGKSRVSPMGKKKESVLSPFSPCMRASQLLEHRVPKPSPKHAITKRLQNKSPKSSPKSASNKKHQTLGPRSRSGDEDPPSLLEEKKATWMDSGSEWSCDLDDLSDSSSIAPPEPNSPLQQQTPTQQRTKLVVPEERDISPPPPPLPPTMTSMSPYSNGLNKKLERMSANGRMERVGIPFDSPGHSQRFKHLSLRGTNELPPAPSPNVGRGRKNHKKSRGSSWLVSPSVTSRSRKKSSKSSLRAQRASHVLMHGLPNIPFIESSRVLKEEEELEKGLASSSFTRKKKQPPTFRPLDKILMRDYPSANTATTFLTADTDAVNYSMSNMFPLTKETERIILKKIPDSRNLLIETSQGERMGTVDFSMVNQGKRLIKDSVGRTCALIMLNGDRLKGKKVFKICGNKPASRKQRLSNETGYYTWAEVRNSGSLGGKFVMQKFSERTSSCSAEPHWTKPFGSLFSKKSRGHFVVDEQKKECVKMVNLKKGKGIIVGPNKDLCLMLAYAVCVEEMLDYRLR